MKARKSDGQMRDEEEGREKEKRGSESGEVRERCTRMWSEGHHCVVRKKR